MNSGRLEGTCNRNASDASPVADNHTGDAHQGVSVDPATSAASLGLAEGATVGPLLAPLLTPLASEEGAVLCAAARCCADYGNAGQVSRLVHLKSLQIHLQCKAWSFRHTVGFQSMQSLHSSKYMQ